MGYIGLSARNDIRITTIGSANLDGSVIVNESSADKDFRVESDGNTHMLFVNGGNNCVGIGNASPTSTLHITGTVNASGVVTANAGVVVDNITIDGNDISTTNSNGNLTITPNGTGDLQVNSDRIKVRATEGESAAIMLATDEQDDAGDSWNIISNTDNTFAIQNDVSGSADVTHFSITPNATVANSVAAFAGKATFANNVGVGTSSPTDTGSFGRALDVSSSSGAAVYVRDSGGSKVGHFGQFNEQTSIVSRQDDGNIAFYTGASPVLRMKINTNGTIQTNTKSDGSVTSNVRFGVNAGDALTTGGGNVIIGDGAFSAEDTGSNHVAIGKSALAVLNAGGNSNVAVGLNALAANVAGGNNTAIGTNTLAAQNTSGGATDTNNTAVGNSAGTAVTSGQLNTFVGSSAGAGNQSSDSNTAIGAFAFDAGTGANNTAVGSGALGGSSNSGGENVAVGVDAGNTISSGQRNTIVGTLAADALSTGQSNTAIGYASLGAEDTGSFNTAIGREALKTLNYDGNGFNVALGYAAGMYLTTGVKNTLLGTYAGDNITSEDFNTLIGYACGDALTTGKLNTAVGAHSLDADTKGWASTAVGYFALGAQTFTSGTVADNQSDNTAMGYFAGSLTTTGKKNTYIGSLAGDDCIDGNNNVAVGYFSLSADHGDGNTAVGIEALKVCTGSNNTAIGKNAGNQITSGSNQMALGHDASKTGSPGGAATDGSNAIYLGDENVNAAYIQVDWTVTSDERDKTDFTALNLGLDFVKAMKPYTFKWDKRSNYGDKYADDYDLDAVTSDGTHKEDWLDLGFKAQDVKALEEASNYKIADKTNLTVSITDDGKQYGMKYAKLVPILVKAIQELEAKVAKLEGS